MANAPFQIHFLSLYRRGGCFWGHVILSQHVSTPRPTRRLAQALRPGNLPSQSRRRNIAARRARPRHSVSRPSAGGGVFGGGWSGVLVGVDSHLVCFARSLRCSVCLLGLLLCACYRLFLPLLDSFIFWSKAPCLVRLLCQPRAPLCPWHWGT